MHFAIPALSSVEVEQLAYTLADFMVVCKDGSILWNKSLLAAWSPFLGGLICEADSVLILKDFTTALVKKCFSLLCCLKSLAQIDDSDVIKLCSILMIGTGMNGADSAPIKMQIECETPTMNLQEIEVYNELEGLDSFDQDSVFDDVQDDVMAAMKRRPRNRKRRETHTKSFSDTSIRPRVPNVWIKDPSPDRYMDGVKTEEYYMSAESLAAGSPYTCLMCHYMTREKRNLKVHFQRMHSKEKLFKCIVCGLAKANTSGVVEHWQRKHNQNKNEEYFKHTCGICCKMFLTPYELKRHKFVHKDLKLTCKYCSQSYKTPDSLDSHQKCHEAVRVPCNICGKILQNLSATKMHEQLVHTNTHSVDCDLCGKTLKSKICLKMHMKLIHSKEVKTHLCHLCHRSFRVKSQLQNHIEVVHEKSQMFPCPYCKTVLSSKGQFKRHSQRRHNGRELSPELKELLRQQKHLMSKVNTTI